jgi:hypothetical protein
MIVNVQSRLKQEARDPKMLLKNKKKIKILRFVLRIKNSTKQLPEFGREEFTHDEERNISETARVGDDKE